MTFLLIGSSAAHARLGHVWREPSDQDAFTDEGVEGYDTFWDDTFSEFINTERKVATLDELYTIKLSHLYWEGENGKWRKHMDDAWRLKGFGAKLIPEMHDVLYKVWEEKFGRKQVDLNMDKADFFDDAVPRKWDHDSIHMSVAYGERPVYESMLKDGAEVAIDMRKVWSAPFDAQVRLFREEIFATALERKVIPSDYAASPSAAYAWALRRTITSLTKGKSARFIADNLDVFRSSDVDYVAQHKRKAHLLVEHERKG